MATLITTTCDYKLEALKKAVKFHASCLKDAQGCLDYAIRVAPRAKLLGFSGEWKQEQICVDVVTEKLAAARQALADYKASR